MKILAFYVKSYKKCIFLLKKAKKSPLKDQRRAQNSDHPYLIFVSNAGKAVKFLVECKKNPEKRENYCFGLNLYHNSDHVNVLFYTKCAILHRYQCFNFILGV